MNILNYNESLEDIPEPFKNYGTYQQKPAEPYHFEPNQQSGVKASANDMVFLMLIFYIFYND